MKMCSEMLSFGNLNALTPIKCLHNSGWAGYEADGGPHTVSETGHFMLWDLGQPLHRLNLTLPIW